MSSALPKYLVFYICMKEIRFAENLKQLRQAKGLTQEQLGAVLGIDQRTISAWENKVCRPDYETLVRLCEIFGESLDGLLT